MQELKSFTLVPSTGIFRSGFALSLPKSTVSALPPVWFYVSSSNQLPSSGIAQVAARWHACVLRAGPRGWGSTPPCGARPRAPPPRVRRHPRGAREGRVGVARAVGRMPSRRHVGPGSGGVAVVAELLRLGPVEVERRPRRPGTPGRARPRALASWPTRPCGPAPRAPAPGPQHRRPAAPFRQFSMNGAGVRGSARALLLQGLGDFAWLSGAQLSPRESVHSFPPASPSFRRRRAEQTRTQKSPPPGSGGRERGHFPRMTRWLMVSGAL